MNFTICSFNNRLIVLLEAPKRYKFTLDTVNCVTVRQTYDIYPNFIQNIAFPLADLCRTYAVVAILYHTDSVKMSNFPNGVRKTITYYVYYTTMDDCIIDNVFYDELLTHLTQRVHMSPYVAQVFLQSLRHGFNKPDARVDAIVQQYNLRTHHDDLEEIRQLVLKLTPQQKTKIEMLVAKNSTFNSILPNMLLLNVTNCTQQESLSIKYSDGNSGGGAAAVAPIACESTILPDEEGDGGDNDDDDDEVMEDIDYDDNNDVIKLDASISDEENNTHKYRTYVPNIELHQHYYYCTYVNRVVVVEANMQMSVFNNLIMKNLITAFIVKRIHVDQLHIYLYIDEGKFNLFSKMRIHGKILQYKIHNTNFAIDSQQCTINYNIDMRVPQLYGTAQLVIGQVKLLKDTFKAKIKVIQLYVIVCGNKLHKIMTEFKCICKIVRIITSPYDQNTLYHTLVYIHEQDIDFLYEYLPNNGLDGTPCRCSQQQQPPPQIDLLPHSQKMWQTRPCVELLFHTHFDWTMLKINSDYARRPNARDIFQLYDVYESGKFKIAHLLETKVFKASIENLTTFKFYHETGLLYPFHTSGHEELYIYTLIKMTRIVYRCIVMPLMKLEQLTQKSILPSKYMLTYAFIDDPLTPTISVRGPQSTRNLKAIETTEKMFDTKVINVTMLMNSFNLCGSESNENKINI